jgi:uncharacterized membrane protein YfhO
MTKRLNFFAVYSVTFLFLSAIVFGPYFWHNRTLIWHFDSIDQHLNALAYWGEYLRRVFFHFIGTGDLVFPMFDFSIGLGADILGTLHYYSIGDPLNLLAVFVPLKHMEFLYVFLIFLRLYLAGLTFIVYCRYLGKSRSACLCGAWIYVFCGYAVFFAPRHPFFITPMIYLPLLALGAEKIFKGEKPYLFILTIFVSAISSFYFFYKLTLLIVIYAAIRFFTCYRKNFFAYLGKFSLCYVVGLIMSGIIFLPSIMYMLSTSRASNFVQAELFHSINFYQMFIVRFLTFSSSMDADLFLVYPPIAAIAIIYLFIQKKENIGLKTGFILLTAFIMLPFAGLVFNGFTFTSHRWVFGYSFLVALTTVQMLPSILNTSLKRFSIFGGIFTLLGIWLSFAMTHRLNNPPSPYMLDEYPAILSGIVLAYFGGIFIIFSIILFIRNKKTNAISKTFKNFVLLATIVGIALQGSLMGRFHFGWDMQRQMMMQRESMPILLENASSTVSSIGNNDFYRYERHSAWLGSVSHRNHSLINQESTTHFFWSILISQITEFYQNEMHFTLATDHIIDNMDNRAHLMSLTGVKYFVVPQSRELQRPYGFNEIAFADENYTVYENPHALPLGYTYNFIIPRDMYENFSPIEQQQSLLQGAVVYNYEDLPLDVLQPIFNHSIVSVNEIDGGNITLTENTFIVPSRNSVVHIYFDGIPNTETYLSLHNFQHTTCDGGFLPGRVEVHVSDDTFANTITYWSPHSPRYTGQHDFLLNMGYRENERSEILLTFVNPGTYTFDMHIYGLPMYNLPPQADALRESILENINYRTGELFGTHRITGSIETDNHCLLALSIPYSLGWRAYVNGERTEIHNVNTAFMGIHISPGSHEITLAYRTPYIIAGGALSLLGILIFFAMYFIEFFIRYNQRKNNY